MKESAIFGGRHVKRMGWDSFPAEIPRAKGRRLLDCQCRCGSVQCPAQPSPARPSPVQSTSEMTGHHLIGRVQLLAPISGTSSASVRHRGIPGNIRYTPLTDSLKRQTWNATRREPLRISLGEADCAAPAIKGGSQGKGTESSKCRPRRRSLPYNAAHEKCTCTEPSTEYLYLVV